MRHVRLAVAITTQAPAPVSPSPFSSTANSVTQSERFELIGIAFTKAEPLLAAAGATRTLLDTENTGAAHATWVRNGREASAHFAAAVVSTRSSDGLSRTNHPLRRLHEDEPKKAAGWPWLISHAPAPTSANPPSILTASMFISRNCRRNPRISPPRPSWPPPPRASSAGCLRRARAPLCRG